MDRAADLGGDAAALPWAMGLVGEATFALRAGFATMIVIAGLNA